MSVTAKDIANLLNVSPATVSLALNNRPGVSQEMRKQVLETARQLGYMPPQRPATPRKKNVGLLVFKKFSTLIEGSLYWFDLASKISECLNSSDYNLILLSQTAPLTSAQQYSQICEDCVGVIVIAFEADRRDLEIFEKSRIPTVLIGNYHDEISLDAVCVNNKRALTLAFKHLYDNGHRKIGFIDSAQHVNSFTNRYHCFQNLVRKYQICNDYDYNISLDYGSKLTIHSMKEYLLTKPELPSAYIAANDTLAAGTMQALTSFGYHIPDDICIVGIDDQPIPALSPQLTSIRVPTDDYAQSAVYLLIKRIESSVHTPAITIYTGVELVARESSSKKL